MPLKILFLHPMGGLNSQRRNQELHALPIEPGRHTINLENFKMIDRSVGARGESVDLISIILRDREEV